MDILECIKTRRSIRKYKSAPVEWDKICTILEAGKSAPSSGNLQNWKFVVVESQEKRNAIAEVCLQQQWMSKAPVHIVICSDSEKVKRLYGIRGEKFYSIQNCAAAAQNMLLMAHELGLGSCWVGAFDEENLKTVVKMPPEIRPQSIITIGYPDEVVPQPPKFTLENVMYFRDFGTQGNRVRDPDEYAGNVSVKLQKGTEEAGKMLKKLADKLQRK